MLLGDERVAGTQHTHAHYGGFAVIQDTLVAIAHERQ